MSIGNQGKIWYVDTISFLIYGKTSKKHDFLNLSEKT